MAAELQRHPTAGEKPGKTNVRPIRARALHRRFPGLCARSAREAGKKLHVDNLLKSSWVGTTSSLGLSEIAANAVPGQITMHDIVTSVLNVYAIRFDI